MSKAKLLFFSYNESEWWPQMSVKVSLNNNLNVILLLTQDYRSFRKLRKTVYMSCVVYVIILEKSSMNILSSILFHKIIYKDPFPSFKEYEGE